MKLSKLIIIIALVSLCAAGWAAVVSQKASERQQYENHMTLAENCMERGLYQRAAENYIAASDGEPDEGVYVLAARAYALRYDEAPEDTFEVYSDFLETALKAFPGNDDLLKSFIGLYVDENGDTERPSAVYPVLKAAVEAGREDEELLELLSRTRYAHTIRANSFGAVTDGGSGIYAIRTEKGWNLYSTSEGTMLTSYFNYVGPCGGDTVTVTVGEDSRLFNAETGLVMGIFKNEVVSAGVWSEGMIPALADGSWGYYDEYADLLFGGYEFAGTFQNGLAAVKQGGRWTLVDSEGGSASDTYEEIVLDRAGRYLSGGRIVVREQNGYAVYDDKWKRVAELNCDELDVRTEDDLIAFRSGQKWGFVDMEGNVVLKPEYAAARSFSNGIAAVQRDDGLWGFIDKTGHVVIDFEYADAGYFDDNGFCAVRLADENGQAADPETGEVAERWTFLSLRLGILED